MQQNTLERRLELLRLEGNGLMPPEIVKELSAKFAVTSRTVYYDLQTRGSWQPVLSEMKEALLRAVNRYDQLFRKASLVYMQASDVRDKIAALGLMRIINRDVLEALRSTSKIEKPQIETWREGRTEQDLEEDLREYDEALETAARRNLEARIAELQTDSRGNGDEQS
jgi:hypothetical protein